MTEPVLSVIVTCYNQRENIAQTLDSILTQEHDYPYEIVVGDDGSTDGSREVLAEYASRYPDTIRLIFNERNMKMIGNFFNIIKNSRGRYVSLCSVDDWWLPGKVKMQVDFLERNPSIGMVYGKTIYLEEGKGRNGEERTSIHGRPVTGLEHFLVGGNGVSANTVMKRRELVLQYLKDADVLNRDWIMEDYPMWMWFSCNSKIAFQDETVAVYRILPGSHSHPVDASAGKLRYKRDTAIIREWFSKRYLGHVLPQIHRDYIYSIFGLAVLEGDYARLREIRPDVRQLHKDHRNGQTRKMTIGLMFPRTFTATRRATKSIRKTIKNLK